MLTYAQFCENRAEVKYFADDLPESPQSHYCHEGLWSFFDDNGLSSKKCLGIGSGVGRFQGMLAVYWGVDVSESLRKFCHKIHCVSVGRFYPLPSESFGAIWTLFVYEHLQDLQLGILEIKRLLKPAGLVFFAPAWQCRSWGGQGYWVRPYGRLRWWEMPIKATIPLRDSMIWRSINLFSKRLFWHLIFLAGCRLGVMRFTEKIPNHEIFCARFRYLQFDRSP